MYTEQKDYFYKTLNQETQECENDYFRILAKDAIRNAWIAFQYQNEPEKGLKLIKQAFTNIQEAKKVHFRLPKKELILMKAFLLSQLNETSLGHFELQHLPKSMLESPITFQEKEWAIKTLLGWGLEEDKAIDLEKMSGFDMMLLWAKGLVQKIENSSEEISVLVKESLRSQPNFEHALYFLKYTKDNLALIHKYGLEQELPSSQEFQKNCAERSYLTLEALQILHQSFKRMIIDIPNLDDLLSFYDNVALAEIYLFALQGASGPKQLTSLYNSLLPKLAEKQSFWIETKPVIKISKKVVFIDSFGLSLDTCQGQIKKISELYPSLKMLAVCYPQKSLYQLGESYLDQKVVFQLQKKIEEMDFDQPESPISVYCHQRGEKIALQVVEPLAKEIQKKIRLTVFSSVIGEQSQKIETTYFLDKNDRLALLAKEIFKNKLKNSLSLEESFYSTQVDKTIGCFYNIKFFNQYIN